MRKVEEQSRFWMVYNTGPYGGAPFHKHQSRESADKEAQRLARENPGQSFIVLKSMGGFRAAEPRIEPVKMVAMEKLFGDDIPF